MIKEEESKENIFKTSSDTIMSEIFCTSFLHGHVRSLYRYLYYIPYCCVIQDMQEFGNRGEHDSPRSNEEGPRFDETMQAGQCLKFTEHCYQQYTVLNVTNNDVHYSKCYNIHQIPSHLVQKYHGRFLSKLSMQI